MKVRTKTENRRYVDFLEEAIDRVGQAADCITYSSYPEINRRIIAKLEEAMCTLEEAMEACTFKP